MATWLCIDSRVEEVRGVAAILLQKQRELFPASENRAVTLTRATLPPSKEHMWQGRHKHTLGVLVLSTA